MPPPSKSASRLMIAKRRGSALGSTSTVERISSRNFTAIRKNRCLTAVSSQKIIDNRMIIEILRYYIVYVLNIEKVWISLFQLKDINGRYHSWEEHHLDLPLVHLRPVCSTCMSSKIVFFHKECDPFVRPSCKSASSSLLSCLAFLCLSIYLIKYKYHPWN